MFMLPRTESMVVNSLIIYTCHIHIKNLDKVVHKVLHDTMTPLIKEILNLKRIENFL